MREFPWFNSWSVLYRVQLLSVRVKKKKSQNCEDLESSIFHALFWGKLLQQKKEVSQVAIHKLATLTQNRDRQKSLG